MTNLRNADCCFFCKYRGVYKMKDAVECRLKDYDMVFNIQICDRFERREEE